MKVYRVYVTGIDTDGKEFEDTKGIFTSKEKALKAIEYGKSLEVNCYHGEFYWHFEAYECDVYCV